jgi:hypothetical protein
VKKELILDGLGSRSSACIWMAQDQARKSTINVGFWTPPSILPLMGGGGPECVINRAHRSVAQKQAHRSMAQDVFRTPPTDLPLTEGGVQNGILPLAGPSLYVATI